MGKKGILAGVLAVAAVGALALGVHHFGPQLKIWKLTQEAQEMEAYRFHAEVPLAGKDLSLDGTYRREERVAELESRTPNDLLTSRFVLRDDVLELDAGSVAAGLGRELLGGMDFYDQLAPYVDGLEGKGTLELPLGGAGGAFWGEDTPAASELAGIRDSLVEDITKPLSRHGKAGEDCIRWAGEDLHQALDEMEEALVTQGMIFYVRTNSLLSCWRDELGEQSGLVPKLLHYALSKQVEEREEHKNENVGQLQDSIQIWFDNLHNAVGEDGVLEYRAYRTEGGIQQELVLVSGGKVQRLSLYRSPLDP